MLASKLRIRPSLRGLKPLLGQRKNFSSGLTSQQHIDLEDKYVAHNYKSIPVVVERGERIYVWDREGTKYYDFMSGYSSTNQGHCHPKIVEATIKQVQKVTQTSRAFLTTELNTFSEYICNLLGYDKFLPSSSGVEACESAIKVARKWGYEAKGVEQDRATVLMANSCFWGRSITACSGSSDPIRYNNFGPLTPGFPLVDYNNVDQIQGHFERDPNCVGIMLEPIQGEGGVIIPEEGYLLKVRELCQKHNVLFICDEVQTGLGRTGKLMGYNWDLGDEIKPDIITLGKAVSGGVTPVSGILAQDEIMSVLQPGDHGSTYGGNPLGMAIAKAAVQALVEDGMVENSLKMGAVLTERFNALQSPLIKEVRSRGLFCAIELHSDNKVDGNDFAQCLLNNGLITKATHKHTVRFAPALVIEEHEVHEASDIIQKALNDLEKVNASR